MSSYDPLSTPYGVAEADAVGAGVSDGVGVGVSVGVGDGVGVGVGVGNGLGVGAMLGVGAGDAGGVGPGVTGATVGCVGGTTIGGSVGVGSELGESGVRGAMSDIAFRRGSIDGRGVGAAVPTAPRTPSTAIGVGDATELNAAGRSIDRTTMSPVATPSTTALRTRAYGRMWNGPGAALVRLASNDGTGSEPAAPTSIAASASRAAMRRWQSLQKAAWTATSRGGSVSGEMASQVPNRSCRSVTAQGARSHRPMPRSRRCAAPAARTRRRAP